MGVLGERQSEVADVVRLIERLRHGANDQRFDEGSLGARTETPRDAPADPAS